MTKGDAIGGIGMRLGDGTARMAARLAMALALGSVALTGPAAAQIGVVGTDGPRLAQARGGPSSAANTPGVGSAGAGRYDRIPTLSDRPETEGPGGRGREARRAPGDGGRDERRGAASDGLKRHGGTLSERQAARRAARERRHEDAEKRAHKMRHGFRNFIVPYVLRERDRGRDDDDRAERGDGDDERIVEPVTVNPEAAPPEYPPAEPLRLRAGQREPAPDEDVAAALTITVSARGGTLESVAGSLDDKRARVLRAVANADGGACVEGAPALDIARDDDDGEGFRGEGRLALRVSDAATVLGAIAALPEDTVSGFTTDPSGAMPEDDRVAEAEAEAPTRGFQRAPGRRTTPVSPGPRRCSPLS